LRFTARIVRRSVSRAMLQEHDGTRLGDVRGTSFLRLEMIWLRLKADRQITLPIHEALHHKRPFCVSDSTHWNKISCQYSCDLTIRASPLTHSI